MQQNIVTRFFRSKNIPWPFKVAVVLFALPIIIGSFIIVTIVVAAVLAVAKDFVLMIWNTYIKDFLEESWDGICRWWTELWRK